MQVESQQMRSDWELFSPYFTPVTALLGASVAAHTLYEISPVVGRVTSAVADLALGGGGNLVGVVAYGATALVCGSGSLAARALITAVYGVAIRNIIKISTWAVNDSAHLKRSLLDGAVMRSFYRAQELLEQAKPCRNLLFGLAVVYKAVDLLALSAPQLMPLLPINPSLLSRWALSLAVATAALTLFVDYRLSRVEISPACPLYTQRVQCALVNGSMTQEQIDRFHPARMDRGERISALKEIVELLEPTEREDIDRIVRALQSLARPPRSLYQRVRSFYW